MSMENFSVDSAFLELSSKLPTIEDLKNTEQDPGWHSEGNVYIHTCDVVNEAKKLCAEENLSEAETLVILYACAYHDIAKPLCTKIAEVQGIERVTSPNHEDMGASLLALSKKPKALTDSEWLLTIKLVKYHKDGKLLVVRNKEDRHFFKLFRNCNDLKMLYIISKADIQGRVCEDQEEQLLYVEMFREECERLGIFDITFNEYVDREKARLGLDKSKHNAFMLGYTDLCSGKIQMLEECLSMPYFYNDKIPTVYIAVGIPASGKTHLRKELDYDVLISLDDIGKEKRENKKIKFDQGKVMARAKNMLKEALRNKQSVYWDATNYRIDFRSKIISIADNYGNLFKTGVLTQLEVILKDADACINDNRSRACTIPEEYIDEQRRKYQMPDDTEACSISWRNSNLKQIFPQ